MKVSSTSEHSLETSYITSRRGETVFNSLQKLIAALLAAINQMGTAIALGEKGDLDAMQHFRTEKIGSK